MAVTPLPSTFAANRIQVGAALSYGHQKSAKRQALEHAQSMLGRTGIGRSYARSRNLGGAIILMYHSIAADNQKQWIDPSNRMSPSAFKAHARFLAKRRKVLALSTLIEHLERGETIAPGTVVLTFDDGYLDNLEIAFPILDYYQLPATLFLPTRYVDNCENHWIDRLYSLFRTRASDSLEVDMESKHGRTAVTYVLKGRESCRRAYGELAEYLLGTTYEMRERVLAAIAQQLSPSGEMPKLTMDWSNVRRVIGRFPGIEIGSHSETHLDLSAYPDDIVQAELSNSKDRIETMTGKPLRVFSFPYNRVSASAIGMLKPLGYDAAVASSDTEVRVENSRQRYRLPRYESPSRIGRLAFVTSGAFPELSIKLLGRS